MPVSCLVPGDTALQEGQHFLRWKCLRPQVPDQQETASSIRQIVPQFPFHRPFLKLFRLLGPTVKNQSDRASSEEGVVLELDIELWEWLFVITNIHSKGAPEVRSVGHQDVIPQREPA